MIWIQDKKRAVCLCGLAVIEKRIESLAFFNEGGKLIHEMICKDIDDVDFMYDFICGKLGAIKAGVTN